MPISSVWEDLMRGFFRSVVITGILLLFVSGVFATPRPFAPDDRTTVVIVFKDGHRQTLVSAEVARIDVKTAEIVYRDGHHEKLAGPIDRIEFGESGFTAMAPGRNHFIGKWEVGEGNGSHFFITLEPNGDAKKSIGEEHGTWTLVDGEAHISWDDGWHDAIRKVGNKHEKLAFEPGKSFGDAPSNVTEAHNTEPKPI